MLTLDFDLTQWNHTLSCVNKSVGLWRIHFPSRSAMPSEGQLVNHSRSNYFMSRQFYPKHTHSLIHRWAPPELERSPNVKKTINKNCFCPRFLVMINVQTHESSLRNNSQCIPWCNLRTIKAARNHKWAAFFEWILSKKELEELKWNKDLAGFDAWKIIELYLL